MRTINEIKDKIKELNFYIEQFPNRQADNKLYNVQIEILEADDYDDEADKYFDSDDSWLHQAAETAREWMSGGEWY